MCYWLPAQSRPCSDFRENCLIVVKYCYSMLKRCKSPYLVTKCNVYFFQCLSLKVGMIGQGRCIWAGDKYNFFIIFVQYLISYKTNPNSNKRIALTEGRQPPGQRAHKGKSREVALKWATVTFTSPKFITSYLSMCGQCMKI